MKGFNRKLKTQEGLGLVELLISIGLASLLLSYAMHHYLIIKKHSMQLNNLIEEQFDLQLVSDLLRDSIRKAGFTPCLGISALKSLDHRDEQKKLQAVSAPKKNAIMINRMSEHFASVKSLGQSQLLLSSGLPVLQPQTVIIADCYHAEIHMVQEIQKTRDGTYLKLKQALTYNYFAPIYLGEWIEEEFFIQKNKRNSLALFYRQNHTEELTEQIKSLSFDRESNLVKLKLARHKGKIVLIEARVRAG